MCIKNPKPSDRYSTKGYKVMSSSDGKLFTSPYHGTVVYEPGIRATDDPEPGWRERILATVSYSMRPYWYSAGFHFYETFTDALILLRKLYDLCAFSVGYRLCIAPVLGEGIFCYGNPSGDAGRTYVSKHITILEDHRVFFAKDLL